MDTNLLWIIAIAVAVAYFILKRLGSRKAQPSLVKDKIARGAVVVDVRTKGEFASGAYPKARNIPLDALPGRLAELPKDKPIVVYCASGARAAQAARILSQAGFSDVVNAGGLAALR
ncbi:MAG TPA: rhodanese-like domain-containing protein [Treponemataceae bacterium]|nr:rhodanese-like domain-containing protein [Treponemataceae bacterium]HPS43536.1 rhodanese-like domain-containing protein [Treponemataceae bacterium]